MNSEKLQEKELVGVVNNMVLESVFYKGSFKFTLLLEIVLRFHQVQMRWELILHVVHIAGTRLTEAGTDVLLRVNNIRWIMRFINRLRFFPFDQV